jgi:transposase
MKKVKEKRVYERYQAVYLFLKGQSYKEVATVIGLPEKTVCN